MTTVLLIAAAFITGGLCGLAVASLMRTAHDADQRIWTEIRKRDGQA